jgi:hypothetical protein
MWLTEGSHQTTTWTRMILKHLTHDGTEAYTTALMVLHDDFSNGLLGFLTRGVHALSSNFLSLGQYHACSAPKCLDCLKCQLKASFFSEQITSTSHIVIHILRDCKSGCLPVSNFLAIVWKNAPFEQIFQWRYPCCVRLQQLTKNYLGCSKISTRKSNHATYNDI